MHGKFIVWKIGTVLTVLLVSGTVAHAQLRDRFDVSTAPIGDGPSMARDLGADVANSDGGVFVWRNIQRTLNGGCQWAVPDSVVRAVQPVGIELRVRIRCVSPITHADSVIGTCAYQWDHDTSTADKPSWFPVDTVAWKRFLDSLIERYDADGFNDMPGIVRPIAHWHVEQEWARSWCSQYPDTSLAFVEEFVRYERMTYNEIKRVQPNAVVTFAGIDSRHDVDVFYDGYTDEASYCRRTDASCATNSYVTHGQLAGSPAFLKDHRNTLYLLNSASYDEMDIHQYGRWQFIPDVVRWLKDSTTIGTKPIVFLEGGGPFCKKCEDTYHTPGDTLGQLPPELVRDNASYVAYYYVTGIASGVARLAWNTGPEYSAWGSTWGDLDLLDIHRQKKPSYFTYRFLAHLFADPNADTIVSLAPTRPSLYHYRIDPIGTEVVWSTSELDTFTLSGNQSVIVSYIPTVMGDSLVRHDTLLSADSIQLVLRDRVPIFIDRRVLSTGSFAAGWNLISLPIPADDPRTVTLFPAAASRAFSYDSASYRPQDTLQCGVGYWLKLRSPMNVTIAGSARASDTISVVQGWNLIGATADSIPIGSMEQVPAGIVVSDYYGYQKRYLVADTLVLWRGYWVKTSRDGKLILRKQ